MAPSAMLPQQSPSGAPPEDLNIQLTLEMTAVDNVHTISNGASAAADPIKLNIHAKDYPSLQLSGRIISVSFCLPHEFTYTLGEPHAWSLTHRAGTAALFDSFRFLSSDLSSWGHIHVGWTGEITHRRARKGMTAADEGLERNQPKGKHSAPVTDISSYLPRPPFTLTRSDRSKLEKRLLDIHGNSMLPVWLHNAAPDDTDRANFQDQHKWRQYSEQEIFRLFHYKHSDVVAGDVKTTRWHRYVRMNKAFADRVLEVYKPGDVVMVHDYHLLLVPAMLRERIGDIKVNLFLHIPFPSFEYFRALPGRKEILQGMLGADMVAFQAISYCDHFKSCCQSLLREALCSTMSIDIGGRSIHTEILPVGINVETLLSRALGDPAVDEIVKTFKNTFQGKKVIVGRDRVDATRGVLQKLQSFSNLLDRYPVWRDNVVLVQIAGHPTIEDRERGGSSSAALVLKTIKEINGRYGRPGYMPIRYYESYIPAKEYYALLRIADLGLITSVRDGMNTTALEFTAIQRNTHAPLLLSEFSGSTASLPGAIEINPWDQYSTATSIHKALSMDAEERASLYGTLTPLLAANPVQKWVEKSIQRLCLHMQAHNASETRPQLDIPVMLTHHDTAVKRLFIFDYDGTLTPIVNEPGSALPTATLLSHLTALAASPQNAVWVVSGRDRTFLSSTLGHIPNLGLSAEHGCFLLPPSAQSWTDLSAGEDMSWQPRVIALMHAATTAVTGSVLERKSVALTWHYRRADPLLGAQVARRLAGEIEAELAEWDIAVMRGKANIEVRPRGINKGRVVGRLLAQVQPGFVLCVGDDTTDEDMFRALRRCALPMENVFGVRVDRAAPTLASWRLAGPEQVVDLLGTLVRYAQETETDGRGREE